MIDYIKLLKPNNNNSKEEVKKKD